MTVDRPPGPPRRRRPSGFIGMLGLVLAVELGLARAERHLGPISAADWGNDRAAAVSEPARTAEILGFGDSLIKCGLVPGAIEARLDRSAYNLAVLGATPPATYFMLKRALDAGAHPVAIIADAKASTLTAANYRHVVRDWAELIGPLDALQLARDDRDLGLFVVHLIHHVLPSARLRLDLKAAFFAQAAGKPVQPAVPWVPIVERQYVRNRGGIHHPPAPWKHGADPYPYGVVSDHDAYYCYPPKWTPYPTNLVYLDKFLALAASRSIPVFLLVPPIHPGVQLRREEFGLDAAYEAFVRKVRDRYRNVTVVDGRHAGFAYTVFADSHHLDIEGATALSHSLAEVVGRCLGGRGGPDRWEPLPPFETPGARPAAEDLSESRAAVARGAVLR